MTEGSSLGSGRTLTDRPKVATTRPRLSVALRGLAATLGSSLGGEDSRNAGATSLLSSLVTSPIAIGAALVAAVGLGLGLSGLLTTNEEVPKSDPEPSPSPDQGAAPAGVDVAVTAEKPAETGSPTAPEKGILASVADSVTRFFKPKPKEAAEGSNLPATGTVAGPKGKLAKGNASVDAAITQAAKETGEDEKVLRTFISIESQGDPNAKHGSYLGLGQLGADAWNDVKKVMPGLPGLTGKADDPRYDPLTNAKVTAVYLGINRNRLRPAVAEAGLGEPSLMHLYAAHNLGYARVIKMLKSGGSANWDEKTRRAISGQAAELKEGGVGNYFKNAAESMRKHYARVNGEDNTPVRSAELKAKPGETLAKADTPVPATANSSVRMIGGPSAPISVASSESPSSVVLKKPPGGSDRADPRRQQVASSNGSGSGSGGSAPSSVATSGAPEVFRTRNGMMATTG